MDFTCCTEYKILIQRVLVLLSQSIYEVGVFNTNRNKYKRRINMLFPNTLLRLSPEFSILPNYYIRDRQIIALYRPPQKSKEGFIQQLDIMLRNIPISEDLLVVGDIETIFKRKEI